jgi:hypothetical protein
VAITAMPYNVFLTDLGSAVHNFTSDTDMVALLSSAYSPDYVAHTSFANVSSAEVSGNGYTAGGLALSNKSWQYSSTAGSVGALLSADPATWTGLAVTTRYAVFYKSTGTASTSKLIGLLDFGSDRTYDTEPFQLSFPSGIVLVHA